MMMNLPTDALHKFATFVGVAIISASIAHLVVVEERRADAQVAARAAEAEYMVLLQQSEKANRRATELYKGVVKDLELLNANGKSNMRSTVAGTLAGVNSQMNTGWVYDRRGDQLIQDAEKKEIESQRLSAVAAEVSSSAYRQIRLTLVVLMLGVVLFCWGVITWARTTPSDTVTHENATLK